MRKFVILCLFVLSVLGLVAVPATAAPAEDLTALARYFPAETLLFLSVRSDDATIESLDSVLARLRSLLPANSIPPVSVSGALNQFIQQEFNGDFRTVVRSWLGDTAAVGIVSLDTSADFPDFGLAMSITDRAQAEAFAKRLLDNTDSDYETTTTNDYTLYADPRGNGALLIRDDVAFLTISTASAPLEGEVRDNLAASADFNRMMGMLPADDYGMVAYVKTADLIRFNSARMSEFDSPEAQMLQRLNEFSASLVGSQAYGFTLLDGRSLVMDVAQAMGDTGRMDELGLVMPPLSDPVDPAFAARIPADAPFVIQGTGLGSATIAGFENLRVMGRLLRDYLRTLPESPYMDESERMLRQINLGSTVVNFVNLSFAGVTGLNLEKEVLPWMNGDFAFFARLLPLASGLPDLPITLDAALVIEATDPAAAQALVTSIGSALEQYELPFERVGDAIVINELIPLLFPSEQRDLAKSIREFELLLGANADVLTFGTRKAAAYSLTPKGDSLADAPAYQDAWKYALGGSQQYLYVNTRALVPLVEQQIGQTQSDFTRRGLAQVRDALGLLDSASISGVINADGSVVARGVLTLAKEPLPPFQVTAGSGAPALDVPPDYYAGIPHSRLPDGAFVLGGDGAPVTIVEFSDFRCSHCQNYLPMMRRFITQFVAEGQARYEYRILPTAGGAVTESLGNLAVCLDEQSPGAFWRARDLFYELAAGDYTEQIGQQVADRLSLDYNRALACVQHTDQVQTDKALAESLGISGTPAVLVRYGDGDPIWITANGQTYNRGGVPYEVLSQVVRDAQ